MTFLLLSLGLAGAFTTFCLIYLIFAHFGINLIDRDRATRELPRNPNRK